MFGVLLYINSLEKNSKQKKHVLVLEHVSENTDRFQNPGRAPMLRL